MKRSRRLNPTEEQERRAAAAMRDPDLDFDTAIDLANRILAGEEVAEALSGTGLVVDMSPRPAQIAEIETSRGVVEVPVRESAPAPDFRAVRDALGSGKFNLLFAFRQLGSSDSLLADYLNSLPEAEIKKIAKNERATRMKKGSKAELIDALVREAEKQAERGRTFLMFGVGEE